MTERRPPRPARPSAPSTGARPKASSKAPTAAAPRTGTAATRTAAPSPASSGRGTATRTRETDQAARGASTAAAPGVRADSEELARPWQRVREAGRTGRIPTAAAPTVAPSRLRRAFEPVARLARRPGGAPRAVRPEAIRSNVTHRLQARIKEKAAAQRRLSALVWLRRAGYVAALALLAWVVLASPVLALHPDKVEVTGYGTVVEPAAVRAVVDGYEGESLATLSTSRLADDLRAIQGVRDASIDRVWPQGLVIALESREPVAVVPDAEGGYSYVDAEATFVGHTEEAPGDLPVVSVPVGEDHVRALTSVLGVIEALPESVRGRVQDVSADTEDTVSFVLRDGPRVEWGSAEDSELKASVLDVLLASEQAEGASVIDVSAPTLPTVRHDG